MAWSYEGGASELADSLLLEIPMLEVEANIAFWPGQTSMLHNRVTSFSLLK